MNTQVPRSRRSMPISCARLAWWGEPRIAEHRIRVRDVVAARDLGGYTPEEIAASVYPSLTLAQVYAALAYYEDHRAEIDHSPTIYRSIEFLDEVLAWKGWIGHGRAGRGEGTCLPFSASPPPRETSFEDA